MGDELVSVSERAVLRREEAAERLRALADQLSRQNKVSFSREGLRYTVRVPDEVTMEIEIEIGEDNEIEIELSW
ncbi:MAG: amphi-Trp domain-containing protein [Acidimicrobiales bacterium]|jgi:amphi-Trp domain-containing protein